MPFQTKTVNITLTSGDVVTVMSENIKTITGVNGAAVLGIYVNGMGLKYITSSDDITGSGILSLAENFITVPTATGDVYVNAFSISLVVPEGSGSYVQWNDFMGDSLVSTLSTSTVAQIKTLIDAL
tara:strand:- start:24926 stop:25303 length:378 start_codon:yes stop_codon:yes gene_type:complete